MAAGRSASLERSVSGVCVCCGVDRSHRLVTCRADGKGVYRCGSCGLRWVTDTATDACGSPRATKGDPLGDRHVSEAVSGYLAVLSGMGKRPYTMVDLGGGLGHYARAFARKGLTATYIDRDSAAFEHAQRLNEQVGVAGECSDIAAFAARPSEAARFDLVLLRHVIEFSGTPESLLLAARQLCAPGGTLVLVTSAGDALDAGGVGETCFGFTARGLSLLLARCGLEAARCEAFEPGDPLFCPGRLAPQAKPATTFRWWRRRPAAGVAAFARPYIEEAAENRRSRRAA